MVHHSSPVREGEAYKIPLRLSSYNPVNTEGTVTVLDRLTDKQYEIQVHVTSGNSTAGTQSSMFTTSVGEYVIETCPSKKSVLVALNFSSPLFP